MLVDKVVYHVTKQVLLVKFVMAQMDLFYKAENVKFKNKKIVYYNQTKPELVLNAMMHIKI